MINSLFSLDPVVLIKAAGYVGLFFIIFAESGLFVGFFLPGDSLLFTAGVLSSQGYLHIIPLVIITFSAAILGDNFGYAFGKKVGPKIFTREDSLLFKKDYLRHAKEFYDKYGAKTIVLARFVAIVRTFAPILAGVGNMKYKEFIFYNFIGGLMWGLVIPLLGYTLGSTVPNVDHYLIPVILAITFASCIPLVWHFIRERNRG